MDISLSKKLWNHFSDFPLCPTHENGKLICSFYSKKNYVCHSKYLKNVVDKGYNIDKINRILAFTSKPWLKPYIEKNNELRTAATSNFEKNLWKLMNNAMYGKQIENVRKRNNIIHANKYTVEKELIKPTFKDIKKLDEIYLLEMHQKSITLDKPIYGGLAILDFSKIIMNDFFYDYLKPKFENNIKLVYTDTDSFLFQVFTEDFYEDILPDIESHFDTSNFPEDFKTLSGKSFPRKNKKVLGMFKDEMGGKIMERFIGLRSKMYGFEWEGNTEIKCKGITKQAMKTIVFDDILDSLQNNTKHYRDMHVIRSHDHINYTETIHKKVLDSQDEKRIILEDGIHTRPWGY